MTGIAGGGGGGGGGFNYVMNGYPSDAAEGEELYHTGEDHAYVFDGVDWVQMSLTDHGQLAGVGTDNHHLPGVLPTLGSLSFDSTALAESLAKFTTTVGEGYTWVDTGKDLTIDRTNLYAVLYEAEVSCDTDNDQVSARFVRDSDGTVVAQTDQGDGFALVTDTVDMSGVTGTVTYSVEIAITNTSASGTEDISVQNVRLKQPRDMTGVS